LRPIVEEKLNNDYFFQTIKKRGFMLKETEQSLIGKAKILSYDELCFKIERIFNNYNNSSP
jgi:hypothetical protein